MVNEVVLLDATRPRAEGGAALYAQVSSLLVAAESMQRRLETLPNMWDRGETRQFHAWHSRRGGRGERCKRRGGRRCKEAASMCTH